MSHIFDDIGHGLSHIVDEVSQHAGSLLPIVGGVAGGLLGGPWGAAIGSSLGSGLGGGNAAQILESGALGYLGGSALGGMGGGTGLLTGGGGTSLADLTSLSGGLAAPAAAGDSWGSILGGLSQNLNGATLIPALTTAYNSVQQSQQANQLAQIAQQANAFGPYRAQYAAQLNSLMQNPSQIQNMPGYQAALQAIERQMGARGQLGSGMEAAALGQLGSQLFQQQYNNLANLSGASLSPAQATQALTQAQQMGSQATGQLGSALTSLWQ